jgi:hypothetical protein
MGLWREAARRGWLMTRNWWLWAPLAVLCALAALLGLRYGIQVASLTETDVINRFADRYLADRAAAGTGAGAARTDCMAYPAAPEDHGIWLIVSCGPTPYDAARQYEYAVSRSGRLVQARGPETWRRGADGA